MKTRRHLLIASMSLALAACGGGGSDGESPDPQNPGNTPGGGGSNPPEATIAALCDTDYQTPAAPEGDIVGGTASGVRDGVVSLSEWSGSAWTAIGTTTTDTHGRFAFSSVGELNGPVRFELSANANTQLRCESATGCGSVEAGDYYPMPEDYTLNTVVNAEQLNASGTVAVTPVTNMAAQWAMDMPRGLTPEAMGLSAARVKTLFGLDNGFATSLPTVMADCGAISSASSGDQNHAMISAAFSDLAEDEGYSLTLMAEGAAYMYSLLGGQVLTGSGDISKQEIELLLAQYPQYSEAAQDVLDLIPFDNLSLAGLDRLMQSAGDVVRGLEEGNAFSESEGNSLRNRLNGLVSTWNERLITNLVEDTETPSPTDFATGKALLDVYDGYRQDAIDAEANVDAANRNLGWLYIDEQAMADTEGMVSVLSESLGYAVDATICVAIKKSGLNTCSIGSYESSVEGSPYATLIKTESGLFNAWADGYLEVSGTWQGQTVDLEFSAESIRDLLENGLMPIEVSGTISNSTSVTDLDLVLDLDITESDLSGFQDLPVIGGYADPDVLNPLLEELVAGLKLRMDLSGNYSITSSDSSKQYNVTGIATTLEFNRLAEQENQAILSYSSQSTTTNPANEVEGPISGQPMYQLVLDDPLTLQTAYRFHNLGLPPMELEAGGDLTGYEDILSTVTDYITTLLENNPEGSEVDYDAVYAELQTLFGGMDFTSLALNGDNQLRIYSEDGNTLEATYSLTTEEDGGISITNGAGQPQATLYIRGVAGYLYTNDTLVAVANFGDESEGLLVSLVDGDQRAYPSVTRDDEEALQAATWTLLESLFGGLFTAD